MKGSAVIKVCGCAANLFEDLASVEEIEADVLAVNHVGLFTKSEHWVSLHEDFFQYAVFLHERANFNGVQKPLYRGLTHSNRHAPYVDRVWDFHIKGGSSSLFGVFVGLALGYEKVIVCGAPMDGQPRLWDNPRGDCKDYWVHEGGLHWEQAHKDVFENRVCSQSGNTRLLLGDASAKGWL